MKSPQNPYVNNPARLGINIDRKLYTVTGKWTRELADGAGAKADLNALSLSFGDHVITESIDLIHPDDIASLRQLTSSNIFPSQVDHSFRVITSEREIFSMKITGVIENGSATNHNENKADVNEQLLQSVLQNTSSSVMLMRIIRDARGNVVDFEYSYTNETLLQSVNRKVLVGKRLTEEFTP